jgi:hypothetical protein
MKTLNEIKERLIIVVGQIANEKLTGDALTDYKIRYQTGELCSERFRLKMLAWDKFQVKL